MRNIESLRTSLLTHFGNQLIKSQVVSMIGYGSGVFPQTKSIESITKNTIDIIISVKQSDKFHQKNMRKNPQDYQGIGKYIGVDYVNLLNNRIFPIHFNHINLSNQKIKYGIVNHKKLMSDLIDWNFLTLAGRMHKPILPIIPLTTQTQSIIYGNRRYALNIALLMMIKRQQFTIRELYLKICQISYMGDIRFITNVENTNKINNIVDNNLQSFNQVYFPLIRQLQTHAGDCFNFNGYDQIQIKLQPKLLGILLSKGGFPRQIYHDFNTKFQKQGYNGSLSQQFLLMGVPEINYELQKQIKSINRKSSIKMAANVFLGGGLLTNFNYLMQKLSKRNTK